MATEKKIEIEDEATAHMIEDVVVDPKDIPPIDSKYRLIMLAAQRAKQIQRGARIRVEMDRRRTKPTTIARAEIEQNKINFDIIEET